MPTSRIARAASSGESEMWIPSSSSRSALPHCAVMDRLPCLATCTPAPATTKAAIVEILNVDPPSPPVPQVSSSGDESMRASTRAAFSRIARAKPRSSSAVSPLVLKPTKKAEICGVVASPLRWPAWPDALLRPRDSHGQQPYAGKATTWRALRLSLARSGKAFTIRWSQRKRVRA